MAEDDILIKDMAVSEYNEEASVKETVQVIEVDNVEMFTVGTDSAFAALGEPNEQLKHQLLNGRDLHDQHPITAITGLRNELDSIEALQTVYSNEKQSADYYEWEDRNVLNENRIGFFVSLLKDINKIKICDVGEVFGVTVDSSAFIGGQDKVARDDGYGLVAHSGVVHVRCESDVKAGDFVVSNIHGMAKKSDNNYGCKVIALHEIYGVMCAAISLNVSINQMDRVGAELKSLDERLDNAEDNIVSAINLANEAYNKAGEVGQLSEEAIKNALEALDKADETAGIVSNIGSNVSSAKEVAEQARVIAESAAVSAVSIRDDAVAKSNNALKNVNNLIRDLEPIASWGSIGEYITIDTWDSADKDTSKVYYTTDTKFYYYYYEDEWVSVSELNVGASYMAKYIKDDVATKAEIETAESKLETHTSLIEKSAKGFHTLVASVDKYSIGEYSQAYGLTYEQAKSILKEGMIYIPIGSLDGITHIEEYDGQGQQNEFTERNYYRWTGDDWEEHNGSVVFSKEVPTHMNSLKYWYVDSDEAPEGHEPRTLYISDNKKWVKVNVFYGNPNNRRSSSISQEVDKIALEITNARGSAASISARITDTESEVQSLALWSKGGDEYGEQYNLATIKQTADDAGASIAQVAANVGDHEKVSSWNTAEKDTNKVYYNTSDSQYYYYKNGWQSTTNPIEAGLKVTAASIVTAVNNDTSGITLNADRINLVGSVTIGDLNNDAQKSIVTSSVIEYGLSDSATVKPTEWGDDKEWVEGKYMWQRTTVTKANGDEIFTYACIQGSKGKDGTGVSIKGMAYANSTIDDESIGKSYELYSDSKYTTKITGTQFGDAYLVNGYLFTYNNNNNNNNNQFVCVGKIQGPKGDTGATGKSGENGYTPYKGDNGNWYINGQDTFIKAEGKDGVDGKDGTNGKDGQTPTIGISSDGYWVINGVKSNTKALGSDGKNGVSVTRVISQYIVSKNKTSAPSNTNTNWTDNFDTILQTYQTNKKNDPNTQYYIWSREKVEYSSGNPTYSTATVNSANSAIANWCADNDLTKINGAHIATGSVTAQQLSADAITSNNYNSGASGSKLNLNDGTFDSKYFKISSDGKMTATGGQVGGLNISNKKLFSLSGYTTDGGVNTHSVSGINNKWEYDTHNTIFLWAGARSAKTEADLITDFGNSNWTNARDIIENNANFYVTHTGILNAKQAKISGTITAESGEIGGWSISSTSLNHKKSGGALQMFLSGTGSQSGTHKVGSRSGKDWTIWVNEKFGVTNDGNLYAMNSVISGDITAETGNIGGWKIDSNIIQSESSSGSLFYLASADATGYANWIVAKDSSGNITFKVSKTGEIAATKGAVGGWTINSYQLIGQSGNYMFRVNGNPDQTSGDWLVASVSTTDANGNSKTNYPFYVTKQGVLHAKGADISGEITATKGTIGGCTISENGTLQVKDTNISGTISGSKINGSSLNIKNGAQIGNWRISNDSIMGGTLGTTDYVSLSPSSFYAAYAGDVGDEVRWGDVLWCTWTWKYSETYESDKNVKNSISDFDEKYELLFDGLYTCRYKYNHGTSDRYHTGFIAQDVVAAIEKAGLTTKDFAGVVHLEKPNNHNCEWLLRRDEFVALNTWQIQKAKARITELEERVLQLEQLLKE